MASLDDMMDTVAPVKGLLIGDSGSGKTGGLVSLMLAPWLGKMGIVDFDNGVDIIRGLLRPSPKDSEAMLARKAAARKKVFVKTLTDDFRATGGKFQPISATAWTRCSELLNDWKEDNLGPVAKWGPNDVLVIDSMTFAGKAALRLVLSMNGRLSQKPWQSDYGDAQSMLETMLATLYSDAIKCNVLILSHVREVGKSYAIEGTNRAGEKTVMQVEEEGSRKGYAETGTGRALSPIVGRFFNNVLMVDIEGTGPSARRIIRTVPQGNIGLKNSAPSLVKARYDLETGLAEYFATLRGEVVTTTQAAPSALAIAQRT